MCVIVTQLCLTLCDLIGGIPLGSSLLGILQARILEWFFISFSSESSQSWDLCNREIRGIEKDTDQSLKRIIFVTLMASSTPEHASHGSTILSINVLQILYPGYPFPLEI